MATSSANSIQYSRIAQRQRNSRVLEIVRAENCGNFELQFRMAITIAQRCSLFAPEIAAISNGNFRREQRAALRARSCAGSGTAKCAEFHLDGVEYLFTTNYTNLNFSL